MAATIPFYILDDEPPLVDTLSRLVRKVYPDSMIFTANDGVEGWEKIQQQSIPSIIISDVNMPGLGGLQVLKMVRKHQVHKNSYFIVITSQVDKELNLKAVKLGADDFMNKPFSLDQLYVKLRGATRVINAQFNDNEYKSKFEELQHVIEDQKLQIRDLISKIQEARLGDQAKKLPSILESSVWIAKRLTEDEEEIDTISKAALLAFSGKIMLNDNYIVKQVMTNGEIRSPIMEKYPNHVDTLYSNLHGFEDINSSLRHIFENYDGTGIPDKLQAWEIPLSSRILRVCLDYEENIEKAQGRQQKAMEQLYSSWNVLYDHRIVAYYDQYLAMKAAGSGKFAPEKQVSTKELHERMVVARHIITESGLKLMSAGTILTEEKIEKIRQIINTDPLIGKIYVKN